MEERMATQARFQVREEVEAIFKARLDLEINNRQNQNYLVANAIFYQVNFSRFHFKFISDK
jgi:hypothetical protein